MRLSAHFNSKEFTCKCGCGSFIENAELISVLERLRGIFLGKSVHINSGTRCAVHNKAIGGASRSQHLLGTAADITIAGVSPKDVAGMLTTMYPTTYGIGRYNNFTHFDVREYKARW